MKLSFLLHERWIKNHSEPLIRVLPLLRDHGIDVSIHRSASDSSTPENFWPLSSVKQESGRRLKVNQTIKGMLHDKPDMVLAHHRAIQPSLLRSGAPIIVLEHTDGPSLEWSRHFIHLPQIVGVIKGTVFTDPEFYNSNNVEGMYHGSLINDIGLPSVPPIKKVSHLDKVELGYSFGCFPSNKRFIDYKINGPRPISVSFVGSVNYKRSRLITSHRKRAIKVVKSIPDSMAISSRVTRRRYDQILLDSKVCLSPLGYGACYRSFESLYAGCVCVQPDCSYVKSWPNVYGRDNYVECKPDMSDVPEKVDNIKCNWHKYSDWRDRNRSVLLDNYWNDEALSSHLKDIFERCHQRCV